MAGHGKRLRKNYEGIQPQEAYALEASLSMVKERANAKFDETIELAVNLSIDPKKSDQHLRGVVQLPGGTGKTLRVGVFAREGKAKEALEAGADVVGSEDLLEKIMAGQIEFDRCIATPDMMGLVGRLGRILGPKGLMPNPKLGTVTMDVAAAVKAAKGGQVEYRTDKGGIVHAGIGKASFDADVLVKNAQALLSGLVRAKPAGVKGVYIKRIHVSSTMGPGICVQVSTALSRLS
jgi:large subunit ribosomal protein L1